MKPETVERIRKFTEDRDWTSSIHRQTLQNPS